MRLRHRADAWLASLNGCGGSSCRCPGQQQIRRPLAAAVYGMRSGEARRRPVARIVVEEPAQAFSARRFRPGAHHDVAVEDHAMLHGVAGDDSSVAAACQGDLLLERELVEPGLHRIRLADWTV